MLLLWWLCWILLFAARAELWKESQYVTDNSYTRLFSTERESMGRRRRCLYSFVFVAATSSQQQFNWRTNAMNHDMHAINWWRCDDPRGDSWYYHRIIAKVGIPTRGNDVAKYVWRKRSNGWLRFDSIFSLSQLTAMLTSHALLLDVIRGADCG